MAGKLPFPFYKGNALIKKYNIAYIMLSIDLFLYIYFYILLSYNMHMLTVRIPLKGKEHFNLYANGKPVFSAFDEELGSLFKFDGVVLLQYGWTLQGRQTDHRRAYLICEISQTEYFSGIYLPNVKEPVAVLGIFYGRKIDEARQTMFNLEKICGKDIYIYPVGFWQKISCLLDGFENKRSLAIKSNLEVLYTKYKSSLDKGNCL